MRNNRKTKEELVRELATLRRRVNELEEREAEHKRAEEALQESEEKLQLMFESVTDGIFTMDLNGNYIDVNTRVLEMHGFSSRDEVLGKSGFDLVAPHDIERAMTEMQKVLEQGSVMQVDFDASRVDGSEFPVEVTGNVLRDSSGNPVGFIGVSRDITERKQVENSLKMSRRRFRDLANLLPQSVWEIDTEGNFTFVNQAGFQSYGYSLEEIDEPLNAFQMFIPEDRDRMRENTQRMLNGEELGGTEYTSLRKDGSTFPVIVYSAPIINGNETVGLRGVTVDITERKQAEDALLESEEKYKTLFESKLDGVAVVDETMKLVLANQVAADMFGFDSVEELLEENLFDYIAVEERERVLRIMAQDMFANDQRQVNEIRCFKKSGEEIWVSAVGVLTEYQGKMSALASFRDITEQKRAQAILKAQKELIDRILSSMPNSVLVIDKQYQIILTNKEFCRTFNVKEKDVEGKRIDDIICIEELYRAITKTLGSGQSQSNLEFRYSINDVQRILSISIIRMPSREILLILRDITDERERQERLYLTDRLASIGEMAAGIAHELNNPLTSVVALSQLLVEGDLPDDIGEDVRDIYSEAQRAAEIVRNLLAFSRKHESVKQLTQINDVIEDVLKLRAYEQKVNNIQARTRFDPNLPEIIADYFQIQQTVLNIILNAENAVTSKSNHGELVICTERVNGTIKASFTDDGPGIPEEILSRIFDPFFTTKEVGQGTGLGLSICYGIVTDHSGKLYAESELGKGATFVMEIPVHTQ